MIRLNGGIDYIIDRMTRRISGRRGAEGTIAGLVCLANLCTANNTIAILTVGPIARKIADRFGVDRRRSASLLDTFSCFTQGLLPYGGAVADGGRAHGAFAAGDHALSLLSGHSGRRGPAGRSAALSPEVLTGAAVRSLREAGLCRANPAGPPLFVLRCFTQRLPREGGGGWRCGRDRRCRRCMHIAPGSSSGRAGAQCKCTTGPARRVDGLRILLP